MKHKIHSHFIMALFISFSLASCNSNDKKDEGKTNTDNTATAEKPAVAATDDAVDAVKVSPDHYKVLSDTLGIRVLEATYKPGDSSVMHSHPDNAIYVIQGGMADFYLKDGSKVSSELKAGMSAVRGKEFHSVKNTGKTTMKVLLVEVNRPSTIVAPDATTDATKVAANNYKTLHDSLGIRIVEVNYKPGQSSAFHTHPDLAAYAIEGGTGELTGKDGKKNIVELKTGVAWVSPADGHTGKNNTKKSFKLLLFEVNRARN